jgi:AGCS family alanine or glycine:cation symporter
MWLTGVFGIATKYAEAVLAVKYRVVTKDGMMAGGPMYALERGMNAKWLGMIFASLTAVAAFGIGNMTQANSISSLAKESLGLDPWITGLIMTVLTAIVILGGIKSIASVCEKLVPFMAAFYFLGCLILLIMHASTIPETIVTIVTSALPATPPWAASSAPGIHRPSATASPAGSFSNESGLGSAPIVPRRRRREPSPGLVSSTGTFWDTVVVCAMTGLVIVNSGEWKNGLGGAALTHKAFEDIPVLGGLVLTVGLLTFVSPPSWAGPITARRPPNISSAPR